MPQRRIDRLAIILLAAIAAAVIDNESFIAICKAVQVFPR